jgi:hypothetical protein
MYQAPIDISSVGNITYNVYKNFANNAPHVTHFLVTVRSILSTVAVARTILKITLRFVEKASQTLSL